MKKERKYQPDDWKNGLVTGNGKTGVICAGSLEEDVFIYQNIDFLMPTREPRCISESVGRELHEARQAVIHMDDSWDVHGRKRTYLYPFHPGEQMRLRCPKQHALNRECVCDDDKNEIRIRSFDEHGFWEKRTFASRKHNVIITRVKRHTERENPFFSAGEECLLELELDDFSKMPGFGIRRKGEAPELYMKYRKFVDEKNQTLGILARYPDFEGSEKQERGYLVITRILCGNGSLKVKYDTESEEKIRIGANPILKLEGTEEAVFLTMAAEVSLLGALEDFNLKTGEESVSDYTIKLQQIAECYEKTDGKSGYEELQEEEILENTSLFGDVKFQLSDSDDRELENEKLLQKQKGKKYLLDEVVIRAYYQGRYAMKCCSGYSVPRLCGMWTGEFNPEWNGAYTMDANVNIQVSGMNTGNLYASGLGYIYFILRQIPDWVENAKAVYGLENAILAPVNTDGSRAVMVEYDKLYPFQYWNAGASWMLVPMYEFWQCYGEQEIPLYGSLKDILRRLLHMAMNFWTGLCTAEYYVDKNGNPCWRSGKTELEEGEHYLIIPSYSPENTPSGYQSPVTANAAMDISAAKDCMHMLLGLEEQIQDEHTEGIMKRCREFLKRLPEYCFDETGALQEWALKVFRDQNEHRHISHLYCVWPAYETQRDEPLKQACIQALQNRDFANRGKDDTSSHGWIHRALVAARLKDGEGAAAILRHLFRSDIFYSSFMTDHDTDRCRGVYCTDAIIGLTGVIQEMLLYSDEETVEFLPASAPEWKKGKICGLRTRNRMIIREMEWDIPGNYMKIILEAEEERKIRLKAFGQNGIFWIKRRESGRNEEMVQKEAHVRAGETVWFGKGVTCIEYKSMKE